MDKGKKCKDFDVKHIVKKVWWFGCALPSRNAESFRNITEINYTPLLLKSLRLLVHVASYCLNLPLRSSTPDGHLWLQLQV